MIHQKTRQTNPMAPGDPSGLSIGPLGPLNIPLDPIGPLRSSVVLSDHQRAHQMSPLTHWDTPDAPLDLLDAPLDPLGQILIALF